MHVLKDVEGHLWSSVLQLWNSFLLCQVCMHMCWYGQLERTVSPELVPLGFSWRKPPPSQVLMFHEFCVPHVNADWRKGGQFWNQWGTRPCVGLRGCNWEVEAEALPHKVETDVTLRALTRKANRNAPLALLAPLALGRKIIWNAPLASLASLALVGKLSEMRHLPHLPHLPHLSK